MSNEPKVACLSVRQPWASLIVHNIKPIENRNWPCAYRGRIVIHAGKTWGRDEEEAYRQLLQIAIDHKDERRQGILCLSRSMLGGFVGSVVMRDCIEERDWYRDGGLPFDGWTQWFVGRYGWAFTGARPFPAIIPYKGAQGLFRVPVSHVPGLEALA
jgi:hypothetical protein